MGFALLAFVIFLSAGNTLAEDWVMGWVTTVTWENSPSIAVESQGKFDSKIQLSLTVGENNLPHFYFYFNSDSSGQVNHANVIFTSLKGSIGGYLPVYVLVDQGSETILGVAIGEDPRIPSMVKMQ